MQPTSYHKFQLISPTMTKQKRYRIDLVMSYMLILLSLGSLLKRNTQEQRAGPLTRYMLLI